MKLILMNDRSIYRLLIHPFNKYWLSIYYEPDIALGVIILNALDTDTFEDCLMKTDKMSQLKFIINRKPVKYHKPKCPERR